MDSRYHYLLKVLPQIVKEDPRAIAVYEFAVGFKDELGMAPSSAETAEHLDLEVAVVKSCFDLLGKFGLIVRVAGWWSIRGNLEEPEVAQYSKYTTKVTKTKLSKQIQQRMLNPTSLKRLVKQLGLLKYRDTRTLAKAYKVQPATLSKYLAVNPDFSEQFYQLLDEQAVAIWENKKKNGKNKIDRETFKQYYQDLLKTVEPSGTDYITKDDKVWNTHTLLSLFLWLYKEHYSARYIFMDETKAPQQGVELRFISGLVHDRFEGSLAQAADYIKWIFKEVAPKLSNPLTLKTLQHNTFINQYLAISKTERRPQASRLPEGFLDWCEKHPIVGKRLTLVDLYWMREAHLDGSLEEEAVEVIEEAQRLGLLPEGGNIDYPS